MSPQSPSPADVNAALDAFIEAPNWDLTRQVHEDQQDVLLTLEACLAIVRRLGHTSNANNRGILSTSARLLLIAHDRGIPAAWDWFDQRHQARQALDAAAEALANLPPEQAAAQFQRTLDNLPPPARQQVLDLLQEEAEEATPNHVPADAPSDPAPSDPDPLQQALQALVTAPDLAALFAVIERDQRGQRVLFSPEAIRMLRLNAQRDDLDAQFRQVIEQRAELLERIQRDGLPATRLALLGSSSAAPDAVGAPADSSGAIATPILPSSPPHTGDTTLVVPGRAHRVVPPPTDLQRRLAQVILAQPDQVDSAVRRGLEAWLGVSGVSATREEIDQAYKVFHAATGQ